MNMNKLQKLNLEGLEEEELQMDIQQEAKIHQKLQKKKAKQTNKLTEYKPI